MKPAGVWDPRRIDPALREKYDVRGPRYTSYPPATHFHQLDPKGIYPEWRARNRLTGDPGLSLYYHIPFCRSRCLFCGCHTFVGRKTTTDIYLEALVAENQLAARIIDPDRVVHQVAVGGGTPNFLSASQIHRLLSAMRSVWRIDKAAELSVEIDPRSCTSQRLDAFLEQGFNRFSLGVQDFDSDVLGAVRRGQDQMDVQDVVTYLRGRGMQAINFDLIYGLPGQNMESAAETARKTIELRPSRIALYSYAHVPWIHPHQKALEVAGLCPQDRKAALFLSMMDAFLDAGYVPIGMDHFALPEDSLTQAVQKRALRRNFMGYTLGRGLDLLAFGASAISSIGTVYTQNHKELGAYRAEIEKGRLPIVRGFLLSEDDQIRRELILELFCNFYVDLDELSQRLRIDVGAYLASDLRRLAPMRDDGLVTWTQTAIQVTETGKFFIRNICMNFDRYLEKDQTKRVYSRTV